MVRHAKSSWDDSPQDDHQRQLNSRGLRDARRIGARMAEREHKPKLIISSDAWRAISTARIIAGEMGCDGGIVIPDNDLYLASPDHMLTVLAAKGGAHRNVMLVGHNPGMTTLANQISNTRIDNMPTCSAFCVALDIDDWRDLQGYTGKLAWFDYPKKALSVTS